MLCEQGAVRVASDITGHASRISTDSLTLDGASDHEKAVGVYRSAAEAAPAQHAPLHRPIGPAQRPVAEALGRPARHSAVQPRAQRVDLQWIQAIYHVRAPHQL